MLSQKITLCGAILLAIACQISGHGFMTTPKSRIVQCFEDDQPLVPNLWWRDGGVDIINPGCKAAFQYLYNKYSNYPDNQLTATYPFTQSNEFANVNPNYALGPMHVVDVTGNDNVCSAGAVDRTKQFGDKSGFDQVADYTFNIINTDNNYADVEFVFCATAPHNPSKWWVYSTTNGFNPQTTKVTWDKLTFVGEVGDVPVKRSSTTIPYCTNGSYYKFTMTVPANPTGTYVVVWQRVDPVGEFFVSCMDYKTKPNADLGVDHGEEESVPHPPPPAPETCKCCAC